MAPNVTLHFFAANDLNGSPLLEITDEDPYLKGLILKLERDGLGGGELTLARRVGFALFDSGAVQPEVFVRVLVRAVSDTDYFTGFFLDKRLQTVIHREEDGVEEFVFGGPGPKYYLDRAVLNIEQLTGTGFNLDLENGVWRWNETATAGRVLNRIIAEDAAADDPALPDLTKTFGDANDSSSTPWTNDVAGSGETEFEIGSSLLRVLWELEDLSELTTTIDLGTVATPRFRLEAWQTYGDDVSGSAFGAGVALFREGVNIANDALTVEGRSLRFASHVIVEGKDGAWATAVRTSWSSGEYVKWAKISYPRSSNITILERAGLRWLRRQENAAKAITVEILPGDSDASGLYFPDPARVLWLGNTITLDTSADGTTHTPLDYTNEDQLVTGFELELGPAGDTSSALTKARSWDVKVRLNGERGGSPGAPNQTTTGEAGGCKCLQLCRPLTTSGAEFVLSNAVGADSPDMSLGIQPGEADLLLLDFASTDATLAPTAEYQDINNPPTFTDASPQALTELEFVATADHDMTLLALDDPDIATGTSARILHDHPDGRHAAVALLYRGATVAGLGDLQSGSGTSAAPSITVATSPGDLVVGAVGWHYYDTVNGWALLIQDPDQTHLASATKSGTHQAAIAAAQKVATGSSTTLSWGFSASRQYSVIAVVLPGSASGGDTIEPVGPTGSSSPGSGSRAADCGHVHGHGFLSTDGLHEHDAARIQWDPDGTSSTASNVQDALVEALSGVAPAAHATSHEDGGADEIETEALATAETDTALVLHPDGAGGVEWGADATGGGGGATLVGRTPYVMPVGYDTTTAPLSSTLAANGGAYMVPMLVPARMELQGYTFYQMNTSGLRTADVRLYVDNGDATADFVPGTDAAFSYTPAAADFRHAAVSGAPVTLDPGLYWLVFRNSHATNTLSYGRATGATGSPIRANARINAATAAFTSSYDLSTGWTSAAAPAITMVGRVMGEAVAIFTT